MKQVIDDEVAGAIHQSVWSQCMEHNMEVNTAASVANRVLLRLRELGHYPKKTGSGAVRACENGCELNLDDYRESCVDTCRLAR